MESRPAANLAAEHRHSRTGAENCTATQMENSRERGFCEQCLKTAKPGLLSKYLSVGESRAGPQHNSPSPRFITN